MIMYTPAFLKKHSGKIRKTELFFIAENMVSASLFVFVLHKRPCCVDQITFKLSIIAQADLELKIINHLIFTYLSSKSSNNFISMYSEFLTNQ